MDNRDEIIRTQLDVIGSLINNNIRRMSDDIWGAPSKPQEKKTQDAPPAAEESVEGPAVPRFLQREIPIPPQPATAAPRFDLPEEAARTEEPTATPEPEQPRRPVIVEQSLF